MTPSRCHFVVPVKGNRWNWGRICFPERASAGRKWCDSRDDRFDRCNFSATTMKRMLLPRCLSIVERQSLVAAMEEVEDRSAGMEERIGLLLLDVQFWGGLMMVE
jgi:hypothetical protein